MRAPMTPMTPLAPTDAAYLAGFLDGDGCLNAQIVRRPGYRLGFEIRVSLTFLQKTTRHWLLLQCRALLGVGTVRKRPDGMSEYAIVGKASVQQCLRRLLPHLRAKRRQAELLLGLLPQLSSTQEPQAFVRLCETVDHFATLHDSKGRSVTAATVRVQLTALGLLVVPVETIAVRCDDTVVG